MASPKRGDVVLYTLPKGQTRTAIVLSADAGVTLAVYKQKPDDFALPPNAQSSPEMLLGHSLDSPIGIVGNVAQGDKPGQFVFVPVAAEQPAPAPITPAPVE